MADLHAVSTVSVERTWPEGDAAPVWRVLWHADEAEVLDDAGELIATCRSATHADWVRRALMFWMHPERGQEPSPMGPQARRPTCPHDWHATRVIKRGDRCPVCGEVNNDPSRAPITPISSEQSS